MHVTRLEIRNLRRFVEVCLSPAPGLNLITGDNGAGKTSVLEALHLMAYGRSFRGRVRDGLIRSGEPGPGGVRGVAGRPERAPVPRARPDCATAATIGPVGWTAGRSRISESCVRRWRWSVSSRAAMP